MNKIQEHIICACGCGQSLLKYDKKWRPHRFISGHQGRGRKQTLEHIRKRSDQMRGETHPAWKGGRFARDKTRPYIWMYRPDHPNRDSKGYIPEHRLIMETSIGRYLKEAEIVHHINGNTTDNDIENLELFENNAEHLRSRHHHA